MTTAVAVAAVALAVEALAVEALAVVALAAVAATARADKNAPLHPRFLSIRDHFLRRIQYFELRVALVVLKSRNA